MDYSFIIFPDIYAWQVGGNRALIFSNFKSC